MEGEEEKPRTSAPPRASGTLGSPSLPPPPLPLPRPANARIVFALLWICVQVALVVTADRRPDGAFGFRMFNESSTMKIALFREIDVPGSTARARVHVEGGVWTARAADGMVHRLTWYDRVPQPYWVFDQEMAASYGAKAQIVRLQGALDDLAASMPNDAETRRFLLDVTIRRNGREPVIHHLVSAERR